MILLACLHVCPMGVHCTCGHANASDVDAAHCSLNGSSKAIVAEFFNAVTTNHTWATGGSNDGPS